MTCMVEVIDVETGEVVKTLGPMSDQKASRVERGILMQLNEEKYIVQVVWVSNDIDRAETEDDV